MRCQPGQSSPKSLASDIGVDVGVAVHVNVHAYDNETVAKWRTRWPYVANRLHADRCQLTINVLQCTLEDMTKTSASQLKAKLGKYMRAVRDGHEIVVTDRGTPVARLLPYSQQANPASTIVVAQAREPGAPALGEVTVKAIRYTGRNTTELLHEDRQRR